MSNEVAVSQPKNEVAIIFEKINSGLKVFEEKKAELSELVEGFKDLKVDNIDDRVSISKVNEARKSLKKERVTIQNQGKAMRDPLTQVNKSISMKEAELVSIIEPEEKRLLGIEDWVENEKERIKQEDILAAKLRIQNRIDRLSAYGQSIDLVHIETLPDDQFEKVVERAKKEHELALAEKEAERIRQEAQAEQDRKDREELQALRKKQEEADRILKEREEEIIRKEREIEYQKQVQRNIVIKDRVYRLNNVHFDGQEVWWKFDNTLLLSGLDAIVDPSAEEFDTFVVSHNEKNEAALRELRLAEEREKKEAEEKRQRQLEEVKKEAAAKALAQQREREAEAERQEADRLAAASDKDKYQEIVKYLTDYPKVEMKSAIYKKKLGIIKDFIADLH